MTNDQKNEDNFHDDIDNNVEEHDFAETQDFDTDNVTDADDDFPFDDDLDEDFSDDLGYMEPAQPAKKSSINWFNVAIFGGLAVGAIGISSVYIPKIFNFNSEQGAVIAQYQPGDNPASNKQIAEAAVSSNLSSDIAQSGGLLANPDVLADDAATKKAVAASTDKDVYFQSLDNGMETTEAAENIPTAPQVSDAELEDIYSSIQNVQMKESQPLPSASDELMPIEATMPIQKVDNDITFEPLTAIEMTEVPAEATEETVEIPVKAEIVTTEPDPDPAIAKQVEALSANVNALTEQLSTFMQAMSDKTAALEKQIEEQQDTTANTASVAPEATVPAKAPVKTGTDNVFSDEIIDASEDSMPNDDVFSAAAETKPVKDVVTKVEEPAVVETLAPAPQPKKVTTTPVVRKVAPAPAPKEVYNWALRGASPDQAYLTNKANGTVLTVTVGESVKGLGRITSIARENGRWVVRGTSGTVMQ